jgi:polyhydroxyalkanoate synthesis regulator phasin
VEKTDDLELEISNESWEKYDETFEHYVEECYEKFEEDLTEKEKKRFWIGSLKYYAARYGDGLLRELEKDDGEYAEKVKQNLEEIFEETGRKLEDFFDKNEVEIEALVDQISNDVEAWAEKLKEIFED